MLISLLILRIPTDSPQPPRWDEGESRSRQSAEGRESGYGTTPSRQWRSPPGSGGSTTITGLRFLVYNRISDDSSRVPTCLLSQAPNAHSMTYV
uniref:Secreted protein n=1 Tax=Heterorhabditis bacteriophora TaxID=37862 RepID=A0A1I7X342_HETBA